jgi:hypothetical protein
VRRGFFGVAPADRRNSMIKFFFDNETTVERMLETEPERVVLAILGAVDEGTQAIATQVRQNVSGGVLERRTGTLEESVQPSSPKVSGLTVDQDVTAGGGDAYYGRILEQGVPHQWQEENLMVGHPLAFESAGDLVFRTLAEHPAMPEHPWFFPVLEEQTPIIVEKVKTRIQEELEK